MRPSFAPVALLAALAALAALGPAALAQVNTTFTYQGELRTDAQPASGPFDLRFRLYDAPSGGTQIGPMLCVDNQPVADGRFSVFLNFGLGAFDGAPRYLEIGVRADAGQSCIDQSGFTTLDARQPLTATPYASFALQAANAGALAGQPASFYTSAANLTGTLADARLSTNVTLLSGSQTFTGFKTFSFGPHFSAAGAPFIVTSTTRVNNLNADLLDGLDSTAFALTAHSHDASAIVSGTLADARIPTNIARRNAANDFTAVQTLSATNLVPLIVRNANTQGTGVTLQNQSINARAWSLLTTGDNNADGVGKFVLRDLTADLVRFSVDSTGRVGVGTATPLERLHVTGPVHVASTTHEMSYPVGQVFQLGELNTSNLDFNARLVIAANGNVGVGAANPLADLHIARNGVNVDILLKRIEAAHGFNIGVNAAPKMFISRSDGTTFNDYVTIDGPSGFVGVGTTNPIARLHIAGQLHFDGGTQDISWPTDQTLQLGTFDGTTYTQRVTINSAGAINALAITANTGNFQTLNVSATPPGTDFSLSTFNRVGSDGWVMSVARDGAHMGGITVFGPTVSYNPFTGSHYATSSELFEHATLLSMTGQNRTYDDFPGAEIVYGVRATTTPNDPACLGAFLCKISADSPHSSKNPLLVMAVGNGEMLITPHDDHATPILPGDLLISSHVPGHAMKLDPARFPVAHVVARAAEPLDWSKVQPDAAGVRRAKISVLFTQFTRDASASELARENAALRERLDALEAALRELGVLRD